MSFAAEFATYRCFPSGAIARPHAPAFAGNGEPATGVMVPLAAIENAETPSEKSGVRGVEVLPVRGHGNPERPSCFER